MSMIEHIKGNVAMKTQEPKTAMVEVLDSDRGRIQALKYRFGLRSGFELVNRALDLLESQGDSAKLPEPTSAGQPSSMAVA